jgi:hypothetical protein
MNRKSKKNLKNRNRNKSKHNLKGGLFRMFSKTKTGGKGNNINKVKNVNYGEMTETQFNNELEKLYLKYHSNDLRVYNLSTNCGQSRFLKNLAKYFSSNKQVTELDFILYRDTQNGEYYILKGKLMKNPDKENEFLFSSSLDNTTLNINTLVNDRDHPESLHFVPINEEWLTL